MHNQSGKNVFIYLLTFLVTTSLSQANSLGHEQNDHDRVTPKLHRPTSGDGLSTFRSHVEKQRRRGPAENEFELVDASPSLVDVESVRDRHSGLDLNAHPQKENNHTIASVVPVDPAMVKWTATAENLIRSCKTGMLRDGQDLPTEESGCVTCSCKSAEVRCERQSCPALTCKDKVLIDGKCCPECPKKICQADDGRKFEEGAEWHMGDCMFCECRKGKVLCSIEDCQIPHCEDPVKVPGQCCPVCLDTSCYASNGSRISAEEVWKEGICTHCYCAGGERKCAQEKCPFVNCTDAYTPQGKCCQTCRFGVTDCVASDWSSWNECPIQECGGGMRRRYRSVLIPHRNGGNFCPHLSEAQLCPRLACDVLPVCPVTEWTPWGSCTATCGNGRRMRSRSRAPTTKATMTYLIDCSKTHMQETSHCYAGVCIDSDTPLEVDYGLAIYEDDCYDATWTTWSECSVNCGVGVQRRHQVLVNDSAFPGHLCHLLDEKRKCHRQKCQSNDLAVGRCKVSRWGAWTPCSKSCGESSMRSRYRTVLRHPTNSRRPCPRLYATKLCKSKPCMLLERDEFYGGACMSHDGRRRYSEGEHWLESKCVSCRCLNSRKECEDISCDPPDCKNPIRLPGLCCEFCPN